MSKWLKAFIQTALSQSAARHSSGCIYHSSSATFQSNFLCGNVCNIQRWREKSFFSLFSFVYVHSDRFNAAFSQPFTVCAHICGQLFVYTPQKKWNCFVFVYNSLLEIHGFSQGDKRTEVSTSSVKGDVWSNLKAVLIFLNCVCSVCHY